MHEDRWRAVNDLFHAALERPVAERREFVCTASNGDAELEREVHRLLAADEQAGSYLETPILETPILETPTLSDGALFASGSSPFRLPPGSVLKGRFQVIRSLGEGGMGTVFEALDLELKVHVALKVIRPEIASNPAALSLFRREVRTARTITHPNVCRTYDLDRGALTGADAAHGEFVFLTMELLEGETLAARLKREGPLAAGDALGIARQLALGLDAAHLAGIVHRDIKPANIMLVPRLVSSVDSRPARAVITDFGLALASTAALPAGLSSAADGAGAVGTLAYMAPEQLEPGREISPAADVYAFGLVLFEMITGRRAFPSSNLLGGIAQRLEGPPPSLRELAPHAPAIWEVVVSRCLSVDPAERFATAGEIVDVLAGVNRLRRASRLDFFNATGKPRFRTGWPPWLRIGAFAVVGFACLALFFAGLRFYRSKTNSKVDAGALIYLAPVRNRTGEKELDNITELVQAGLSQSAQVRLVDRSRAGDIVLQMTKAPDTAIDEPIGREIAMRAGAVRAVFATVTGSSGSYKLAIDIQEPDNTPRRYREHWTREFGWQTAAGDDSPGRIPPGLLAAVRQASDWIRLKAGESGNDIARLDIPPQDATTGSWDALDDFTRAMRLHARADTEDAIPTLQHAASLDPNFALAFARLGDFQISLGRHEEGYRSYRKALALSEYRRLARRERDRIAGLAALDSGDFEGAEAAFRDYASLYPDDYLGWFYRGYPLMMLGRAEESLQSLRRARQLDPASPSPSAQFGVFEAALGDRAEALQAAQNLELNRHPVQANYIRGIMAFTDRRYTDADAEFGKLANSPEPFDKPWSLALRARVAAERGQYDSAVELLTEGMGEDAEQGNRASQAAKLLDRAYIERNRHRFAECLSDIRNAVALDDSPQTSQSAAAILSNASNEPSSPVVQKVREQIAILARRSRTQDFGQVSKIAQARLEGSDLLANREWSGAIKAFRRASALDAPASPRVYLADALIAAADNAADLRAARAMKLEALGLYAQVVDHIDLVWRRPSDFPPGFLADQIAAFLRLSSELKRDVPELKQDEEAHRRALDLYRFLRPQDSEFSNRATPVRVH